MPLAPDTQEELSPLQIFGVAILVCPRTGGIWFSEEALGQIKRAGAESLKQLEEETAPAEEVACDEAQKHQCPIDGSTLIKYRYMGLKDIVLEQCLNCGGIWVPHHELDKMVSANTHEDADKLKTAAQEAIGQFAIEHVNTVSRFQAFGEFCKELQVHYYGYRPRL